MCTLDPLFIARFECDQGPGAIGVRSGCDRGPSASGAKVCEQLEGLFRRRSEG